MVQLHPDLTHVTRLLGTWSGRGRGSYPTIDPFEYVETITFSHVGKPFLRYEQRTRRIESDGSLGPPLHAESGFWRFPSPGQVEVVLSHPTGINEIEEGSIGAHDDDMRIELASTSISLTTSAKSVTEVARTWNVAADVITYEVRMAAVQLPLQHHLAAELYRTAD